MSSSYARDNKGGNDKTKAGLVRGLKDGSEALRAIWFVWVPVLLYIFAIIVFYWLNTSVTYQSQHLLLALNVLFTISVSFLILYLATISYLKTGAYSLLFLGCGTLFFALANLFSGIIITDPNTAVTVGNIGNLLTGLCFLGSTLFAFIQKPRAMRSSRLLGSTVLAYLIVLVVIGLLALSAWEGITPAFYVQGHGSTLLRQVVLYTAAIVFVLASVCFGFLYRQSRTSFLIWCSLGLLLIGLCQVTLAISGQIWTPLAWIARLGFYLGGLYLLIAIASISESGGDWRIPLERALRETEEKYRGIVETANEGILILDTESRTTFVNKKMAEMLGYSIEDIVGKSVYDFMDEEAKALAKMNFERRRQGHSDRYEQKLIRKDGTVLWVILSGSPLRDKDGQIIAFLGMHTDITERKRAEEALREMMLQVELRTAELDAAFSSANAGVMLYDSDGNIVRINDTALRFAGLSAGDLDPRSYDQRKTIARPSMPDDTPLDREDAPYYRALHGELIMGEEIIFKREGGEPLSVLISASPIRDSKGQITGAIAISTDITERKQAEEALRESEEKYRHIVETANEGIFVVDADTRITYANKKIADMLGYTVDEMIGMSGYTILKDEEAASVRLEQRRQGIKDNPEIQFVRKDGSLIWVHANVRPSFDKDGKFEGTLSMVTDITERRRAEEALRESEEKYRNIVDTASEGILVIDADARVTFVNKKYAEILGYNVEEMIGMSALKFLDDVASGQARHELRQQSIKGDPEVKIICKDGSLIWAHSNTTPLFHKDGKFAGSLSMVMDITERKQVERYDEALNHINNVISSTLEFDRIIETFLEESISIVGTDMAIICMYENGYWVNRYGHGVPSGVIGKTYTDDEAKVNCLIRQTKKPVIINDAWVDARANSEKANEVEMRSYASYPIITNNEVIGVLAFANRTPNSFSNLRTDFIENATFSLSRAVANARLYVQTKELQLQAELYLDLMGHDISNMHQIVMGQLELAQEVMDDEGGLKAEYKELIDTSLKTLNRSAQLIANVRKLQSMRRGEFKEESIDLNDLLSNIVKEHEFMLPANSIRFVGDGPRRVLANKLLHDVFSNLVGNAIKHSNGNGVNINISLENAIENGKNYYKVMVEDTGPGISDNMKDKVFNRLERGQTTKRGLGLGLYIVKSLVESYQGRVWVEDRVQGDHTKGSRFIVLLPAVGDSNGC
jgi:PAS domain S-box-containing protein